MHLLDVLEQAIITFADSQETSANIFPTVTMKLTKTVRKVQCQAAKLEVLETLLLLEDNNAAELELKLAFSMISTLRQSLHEVCEAFLEADGDQNAGMNHRLKKTIVTVNQYLAQMVAGLQTEQPQVLFLKEVMVKVISELITLSMNLDSEQESLLQVPVDLGQPNPFLEGVIQDVSQQVNRVELELEILTPMPQSA